MTDTTNAPVFRTVTLDTPIIKGDTSIDTLQLRKPRAGEMRGLSMVDVGQLKIDALIKLVPRISVPTITEADVANLDPADLLAIGTEIGGFLLQRSHRADALDQ